MPFYSKQLCRANQLDGFYMMGTLTVKGLIVLSDNSPLKSSIKIKFSYLAESVSITFSILSICVSIKLLWGL